MNFVFETNSHFKDAFRDEWRKSDSEGEELSPNHKELMRILENGRVGIGTDDPQYTLEVNGSFYAKELFVGGNKKGITKNLHVKTGDETSGFTNATLYIQDGLIVGIGR